MNDATYPVLTDFTPNTYQVCERGEKIAVLALGDFFRIGQSVAAYLKEKTGIQVTLINPRFASGVDRKLLDELCEDHDIFLTLEDGILEGGFGQKIAGYLGARSVKVLNYGFEKRIYDRVSPKDALKMNRITPEQIFEDVANLL